MSSQRKNGSKPNWLLHDTYPLGVSCNRIVTRSQTAFLRVKNTLSDLQLFADPTRHQPPGLPHLMEAMKGEYGSLPKTIVTRSTGKYISHDKDLIEKLKQYKSYRPEPEKIEQDDAEVVEVKQES